MGARLVALVRLPAQGNCGAAALVRQPRWQQSGTCFALPAGRAPALAEALPYEQGLPRAGRQGSRPCAGGDFRQRAQAAVLGPGQLRLIQRSTRVPLSCSAIRPTADGLLLGHWRWGERRQQSAPGLDLAGGRPGGKHSWINPGAPAYLRWFQGAAGFGSLNPLGGPSLGPAAELPGCGRHHRANAACLAAGLASGRRPSPFWAPRWCFKQFVSTGRDSGPWGERAPPGSTPGLWGSLPTAVAAY